MEKFHVKIIWIQSLNLLLVVCRYISVHNVVVQSKKMEAVLICSAEYAHIDGAGLVALNQITGSTPYKWKDYFVIASMLYHLVSKSNVIGFLDSYYLY